MEQVLTPNQIAPAEPVALKRLQVDLGVAIATWYGCTASVVGHYVYVTGMLGRHVKHLGMGTIVGILDTVKQEWRWLVCEGPSCRLGRMLVYDDWLYWLGDDVTRENTPGGVKRFDLNLEEWEHCVLFSGEAPCPRKAGSMHLHEERQQVLVFGGKEQAGNLLNDVHMLDLRQERWLEVTVKGKPPKPRYEHCSWIEKEAFFCFGGWVPPGDLASDCLHSLHLGTRNRLTWSEVKGTSPLGLFATAFAVPWNDSMWIFGGFYTTNGHIASRWDIKTQTLERVKMSSVRSAPNVKRVFNPRVTSHTVVKTNSGVILLPDHDDTSYVRIDL